MSAPLCGLDEYGNLEKVIDASSGMPIGAVFPFYGTTPPEHTMACNGAEISRTTYAELFAVIGTTAGEGDGSTTFNVPDLRGMFIRGTGGNAAELGVEQPATAIGIYCRGSNTSSVAIPAQDYDGNVQMANTATYNYYPASWEPSTEFGARTVRPVNVALTYCIVYEN